MTERPTPALSYPDGLKRIRPARIIRTASRAPTDPLVFVLPPHDELLRMMMARHLGGRS
ncbi:MAG TPA: hypothetical protein VJU58_13745 [Microbacterium sp.]|nr:hypothetical protein [Microbacterium sp.]